MNLPKLLAGVVLAGGMVGAAQAATLDYPAVAGVRYQTSGRERPPTVGDWYTSTTTGSTDRVHRLIVEITPSQIGACGGTCDIIVLDADSSGTNDETFNGNDPTRFQLTTRAGTVIASQLVPTGSADNTNLTFQVSTAGVFQITSVTGGFPISGDATVGLNDDDNSWGVRVEGAGDGTDGIVGLLRTSFQQDTGAPLDYQLYFLLGPAAADTTLALRNFDLDLSSSGIVYTRPGGGTVGGTLSNNGVWNNNGDLNTGQDSVLANNSPATTATDTGVWGYTINDWTSANQTIFEVNGAGVGLPVTDRQPTRAGNASLTFASGAACANPGTPVDYAFTVANNYVTNDILNLTLSAVPAGWTAVLLTSGGAALGNSDNVNGFTYLGLSYGADTGTILAGGSGSFILRVTPSATAIGPYVAQVNALSYMDVRVNNAVNTVFANTQATYVCPSIAKAFTPATVGVASNSTMTLTLTNRNTVAFGNVAFTDTFPANLVNATPLAIGGTCTGVTSTATAGGTTFNVTAATVPAGTTTTPASCTITDAVRSAVAGTYNNTTSGVTGRFAGTLVGPGLPSNTATLTVTGPVLAAVKSSAVVSDPFNGTTNPRRIPGGFVDYTIAVTNSGAGAVDTGTTVVIDPIPANTELFVGNLGAVGSGPVGFAQGTTTSGLTYTFTSLASTTDDVSFSNNGGTTFVYTPTANANGTDPTVTHIRINPKGVFAGAGTGNPSFATRFRVRIR